MRPAIGELEARSSNEIANRTRDQHFTSIGQCGNPRRKMYSHALRFLAANFALTCMQSGPDADAQIPGTIENFPGTGNCASGAVKGCVNAVSCPLDQPTAKPFYTLFA